MEKRVWEIVITGGPCSGKSEALKIIPKRLQDMGYGVIILREVAEDIFTSVFPSDVRDIREFLKKYPEKFYAMEGPRLTTGRKCWLGAFDERRLLKGVSFAVCCGGRWRSDAALVVCPRGVIAFAGPARVRACRAS